MGRAAAAAGGPLLAAAEEDDDSRRSVVVFVVGIVVVEAKRWKRRRRRRESGAFFSRACVGASVSAASRLRGLGLSFSLCPPLPKQMNPIEKFVDDHPRTLAVPVVLDAVGLTRQSVCRTQGLLT